MMEKLHLLVLVIFAVLALWVIPAHTQDGVDAPATDEAMINPAHEPDGGPAVLDDWVDSVETIASGWFRTTINGTSANTGKGEKSIAVREDGKTFVSYYNSTNDSLGVAMQVLPLEGNCGTDLAWVYPCLARAGGGGGQRGAHLLYVHAGLDEFHR